MSKPRFFYRAGCSSGSNTFAVSILSIQKLLDHVMCMRLPPNGNPHMGVAMDPSTQARDGWLHCVRGRECPQAKVPTWCVEIENIAKLPALLVKA
jgi:hypothetical protein